MGRTLRSDLDMREGLLDAAQAVVGADDRSGSGSDGPRRVPSSRPGSGPVSPGSRLILLVAPERRTNEPGLSRYPAISLSAAGSASSWAEPMCSMLRDPHQEEECAICTAWAPDAVLTVRTYGLAPPRQCASPPTQPAQFQRESAPGPPNAPQ